MSLILLTEKVHLVELVLPTTIAQGFSPEVARAGLEAEVASWTEAAMEGLRADLPLGWEARAPNAVLVIAARTLPASALRQCLLARALGARVLLKCAAGQEALAERLHALDPEIVPTPFSSDDEAAVAAAIALADTVVVLGADATVQAVRALTSDAKGFAAHGHRVSAAWFGPAPSDVEIAGLAADIVAWDQEGCLAPQVVWVEGGVDAPLLLAMRLTDALEALEPTLPLAESAAQRIAIQRTMPLVAMLGGKILGTPTTIVATLPSAEFRPSPGPRMVWVLPADVDAVMTIAPMLSTLAVASATQQLDLPARICVPGEMQHPPLDWHQDGLHPLASLLRKA